MLVIIGRNSDLNTLNQNVVMVFSTGAVVELIAIVSLVTVKLYE